MLEKSLGLWEVELQGSTLPTVLCLITAPADTPGSHNVVGGKYVPPSMKRATMAASSQPTRRRGAPPDIQSQAAFPTLAAAKQDS